MGFVTWIKKLFMEKDDDMDLENIDDYILKCPKCGSSKIGYLSVMHNFCEVMSGKAEPIYVETAQCMDCGFKAKGEPCDDGRTHLKELVWEKKDGTKRTDS